MTSKNQQMRKKYHRRLVERSKKPGHPKIGQPGSTQRYLSKLRTR